MFDPLVDERVAPNVVVPRHESGDPMIVPRGGDEPIRYSRASSLAGCLAYQGRALSDWRSRYEVQGIARHRDLAARVAAVYYSTGPLTGTMPISERKRAAAEIDECRELAAQRMGIDEAANLGTAGHSLTEPGNDGLVLEELVDVKSGYLEITAGFDRVASEVFVANDSLRAAGTFDSLYASPEFPGVFVVGDTKTGKNYHQAEFEIQLATYAGGEVYLGAGERLTFEEFAGLPVHQDVAYLVHVSVTGAPKPRVVYLDLARGRRLAESAARTRDDRAELDKIGIGEKVDHRGLAIRALDDALAALVDWHDQAVSDAQAFGMGAAADADQRFHADAQALYQRFKPYWQESHTLVVKGRLA